MDDWKENVLFYGLLSGAGLAAVVGTYLLVKRYAVVGAVEFQGVQYPLTEEDKLWMARMVVGETGNSPSQEDGAAVLWSVVTRWRTKAAFSDISLIQLMKAFSQPINPIWASLNGSGCQRSPSRCTPAHLARRARITNMPWSSIPQVVRDLVESFAQGRVSNPIPGYNNFAAAGAISGSSLTSSELPPVTLGGNTFIRDSGSLQGEVRIV